MSGYRVATCDSPIIINNSKVRFLFDTEIDSLLHHDPHFAFYWLLINIEVMKIHFSIGS